MNDPCEIKSFQKAIAEEEKGKIRVSNVAFTELNYLNCVIRMRNALHNIYGVLDFMPGVRSTRSNTY